MASNKKEAGTDFGTRAATKDQSSRIRPYIKTAIVRLALRGLLPVIVAEWLIKRGGLRHV